MKAYVGPNIKTNLDFVEQHLANCATFFVAERLSGADYQMLFPLEAVVSTGAATGYPHITRYVHAMQQRDAYQRALDAGGPYDYLAK